LVEHCRVKADVRGKVVDMDVNVKAFHGDAPLMWPILALWITIIQ
jgi:hypothetical protein